MSRIPLVSDQDATGSVKEIFGALNKGLGLVPNMTRAMANSPAVLQAFAQFNSAMGASKLPGALREQIAVLTAESNACAYCLSAHSALGKLAGLSPAQLDAARNADASDPKTKAALVFAQSILDARGSVSDSDVRAVRSAGYTDGQIAEIVAVVALNIFTNFINRAFDVEIDFPRVEPRNHALAR